MYALGIDIGASSVKLVLIHDDAVAAAWDGPCHPGLAEVLREGLQALPIPEAEPVSICAVDSNADLLQCALPGLPTIGTIPAVAEGVRALYPDAGCIIEIGSQSARFITNLQERAPVFSVNEHCAGGTGSFFEDQMTRLGMTIEDFSALTEQAAQIPRISGRCAVFAKSDIVHRQQEGVTTPDILLGLCYAMIRNYKATVVRNLPVKKPMVFCGGVTRNAGVIRAIRDVFELSEGELLVPEEALYMGALGAANAAVRAAARRGSDSPAGTAAPAGNSSRTASAGGAFLCTAGELLSAVETVSHSAHLAGEHLQHLALAPDEQSLLCDPVPTGVIPTEGCFLGIDIGSTSTDLVLTGPDGELVDFQYLRTAGNSERAVRKGLSSIRSRFGEVPIRGVAVTGSGRERIGRMIGADVVRDEITAQARGAAACVPDVDTVFEIGGQDSKYISLKDGEVVDFQMNKICAAGTGSFVEEQSARMGIPLKDFGQKALQAEQPTALGERCTVFIETAISASAAAGASEEDLCAGLCHSIVRNYLHKVVGSKRVGERIVLQGGVAYNPGIVAAFQSACGGRVTVNPYFAISGAYGAALMAQEAVGTAPSRFRGYDFDDAPQTAKGSDRQIQQNKAFFGKARELLLEGYTGEIDPRKKTVGVPYCLMIHRFFPMANAFFQSLGYNVLLSDSSNEETVRLSQLKAEGETCYPVKLMYGHMQQLIDRHVDYIFMPSIHTIKHETSHVAHNYGCVYMQTAPRSIARALKLEEKGITLLNPEFDLDFGQQAMAMSMVGIGSKILGKPKPLCLKAMMSGAAAVKKHGAAVEEQGRQLLASIRPEDKVLVLITRNYGVSDPILNMGIPQLLLERGCKVITLSHLPGHDLDISAEYPNLYWPFGQHIISGAKLIAHHPNLYAVYLTNHGCGPDSMLTHLFRKEMGDKPYLQIEVDEHFSPVGVITRIEAFLNTLSHRPAAALPADFDIKKVDIRPTPVTAAPVKGIPLYLQANGAYSPFLEAYCRRLGFDARTLPAITDHALALGRAETSAKEYLPFTAMFGSVLAQCESMAKHDSAARSGPDLSAAAPDKSAAAPASDGVPVQFLVPQTLGAEADGEYAQVIQTILERRGFSNAIIDAPTLETIPAAAGASRDDLIRAVIAGDLLYAAPADRRRELALSLPGASESGADTRYAIKQTFLPSWEELSALAKAIAAMPVTGRKLAAVGTPLCLTDLDDGIPELLESEGDTVLRAPLSEYLWMLWKDNEQDAAWLRSVAARMQSLGAALGPRSPFAPDPEALLQTADRALPRFAGGVGRYRYAKACQMGQTCGAVLCLEPRYENTSMILDMRGLKEACPAPLLTLSLDHDLDDAALSRLRSFLYYC